ncbi:MAG: RNA polymerase sporulation sigma factor SigG [Clostridia bacterium]|nr:RNA polymerase sporulation sigma factor SigG [Clostridia bacterium]MBR3975495.1 RNA polymerase sporulation sigma factor SigG [Clostridia bacterium]
MIAKVEICGVNTATLKGLKNEETLKLLEKARCGDKKAREKLICGNLRLVLSVIQRFTGRCDSPDDLFQVGCIGLIKAIDNFDLSQGVQFSTYGVPMIIGEIRRFLRDNNSVRVSRSMRDTAYHAMQIKEEFINENNREPTVEEIAQRMHLPVRQVVIALEAVVEPVSLYEPVYSDSGDTIFVVDQLGDSNSEADWIDEINIREAIKNLGEREKQILHRRFMVGKTQTEVAEEIGISQAQVSRLEKAAMDKLRGIN